MRLSCLFHKKKNRRKMGFTMAEMMIVVGIITVLTALAVPALAALQRSLKMMELNANAREVFIAVQNNLTIYKASGTLDKVETLGREHTDTYRYVTKDDTGAVLLLPAGAIDSVVSDNPFVIKYSPKTATVLEVFYAEKEFEAVYALTNLTGNEEAAVAARKSERIGYYNGGDLNTVPVATIDAPQIEIKNEEELTVTITSDGRWNATNSKLTLFIESAADPSQSFMLKEGTDFSRDATGKAKIVLDSLKTEVGVNGIEAWFSKLALAKGANEDFPFSEQINVYAQLESIGVDHLQPGISNTVTSNGLYAQKTENTVQIAYPRHLQNLALYRNPTKTIGWDKAFDAVQTKKIIWPDGIGFVPIASGQLMASYDGKSGTIENLKITGGTTPIAEQQRGAGLFATLTGQASKKIALKNISLVNPSIDAPNFNYVGTLAGRALHVEADNCYVYVRDINNADKYKILTSKTAGKFAGGLFGSAAGVTVTNCGVGLPEMAGGTVGGLIGIMPKGEASSIKNSYAVVDNLKGGAVGQTAMFIGYSDHDFAKDLSIVRCYGVGNVSEGPNGTQTNGFLGGRGRTEASYCAVTYLKDDENQTPLNLKNIGGFGAQAVVVPGDVDCYYMNPEGAATETNTPGTMVAYDSLLVEKGTLPGYDKLFTSLNEALSHPYRADLKGKKYPFPGLLHTDGTTKLHHYGSWPDAPKFKPALAYLEQYNSVQEFGVYGYFSTGDKVDTLRGNEAQITDTKYGLLIGEGQKIDTMQIKVLRQGYTGIADSDFELLNTPLDETNAVSLTANGENVKFIPFTSEAVRIILANSYSNIPEQSAERRSARIQIGSGGNAAEFEVHPLFGAAIAPGKEILGVPGRTEYSYQIRTQAQLANITRFQRTNPSFDADMAEGNRYEFLQTHNIKITGGWSAIGGITGKSYNAKPDKDLPGNVIDGLSAPLFTTVDGAHTTVRNVTIINANIEIDVGGTATGIFADRCSVTVENSEVRNSKIASSEPIALSGFMDWSVAKGNTVNCNVIATEIQSVAGAYGFMRSNAVSTAISNSAVIDSVVETKGDFAAVGLVGTNNGTVTNSRVYSSGENAAYDKIKVIATAGKAYGFTAENKGDIEGSSASATVTGASLAVGFVGNNIGNISRSYTANMTQATAQDASANGFVGQNEGRIKDCYAMVDLIAKNGYIYGFAGNVTAGRIESCYAANTVDGKSKQIYGFNKDAVKGSIQKAYYLVHDKMSAEDTGATALTVEDMQKGGRLFGLLSTGVWGEGMQCYPYKETLKKKQNDFPLLVGVTHYGDWIIIPEIPAGLVYFEQYEGDKEYYISGLDSDGLPVVSLKDNDYTIQRAGYGVLTDTNFAVAERIKVSGSNASTNFDGTTDAKYAFEGRELVVVAGRSYTLFPFKETALEAFGALISWSSESLSVDIDIQHTNLNRQYTFAPFSAAAVASRESNTKFGTLQTPAQVRTGDQFIRINTYMGVNGDNRSPHRYFEQTHDIEVENADLALCPNPSGLISTMQNASYDGKNNTIYNAKRPIFVTIANGKDKDGKDELTEITNVRISEADVFFTAYGGNQSNPALLTNHNAGYIANCHVTDSKITASNNVSIIGGLVGVNQSSASGNPKFALIENCSVSSTKIIGEAENQTKGTEVGGLVGTNAGVIRNSFANADVYAPYQASAFAVSNANTGIIENSFAGGIVNNAGAPSNKWVPKTASGFILRNDGNISNCYTTAVVNDSDYGCGFTTHGSGGGRITNSYSAAKITLDPNTYIQAIIYSGAYAFAPQTVPTTNSYYLETSVVGQGEKESTGTSLTYSEMQTDLISNLPVDVWRKAKPDDFVSAYPFPVLKELPHQGGYPTS